ncbi:MAG: hypothetical protein IT370_13200 [Deltaproteobacteria bacterium]|nr:hypothetical protein [Deltaproteobacteria bacterium]
MRWLLAVLVLVGCQAPRAEAPDALGVLERRCGACHGLTSPAYAVAQRDAHDRKLLRWIIGPDGRIPRAQRELALTRAREAVDHLAPAAASPLLLAPLAATFTGGAYVHPELFASPSDADYRVLEAWVRAELGRARPVTPAALTPAQQLFASTVMPLLERRSCLTGNCHGRLSFSDLKLTPALPVLPERYSAAMLEHNRQAMLGGLAGQPRLVNLAGDVAQSRQLLKLMPVAHGGLLHKGGNQFIDVGDPDHDTLLAWLRAEAAEAGPPAQGDGLLFVRRPRATPERAFEDGGFLGGGDLIWRHADGREDNLTAALHQGPADVRAPALSYDARRVLVALRGGAQLPFDVWEIELATRAARQLTFSPGPAVHFLDPTYVPAPDGPGEVVVVVSNLAGEWAPSSPDGLLGEAERGTALELGDDERSERAGSFDGRAIRLLRGAGAGESRVIRRSTPGLLVLDRPLPVAADSTTHYLIEAAPRMAPSYDLYRLRLAGAGQERQAFDTTLTRMTHALGQVRRPAMRSTGEIFVTTLRTGWQGQRPFFNGAVFRVHPDGSNFHTHGQNRSQIPILLGEQELANGLEVRIGQDADSFWGGQLIVADHQAGPGVDPRSALDDLDHPLERTPLEHSQHSFFRAWLAVDPTTRPLGVSPGGSYRDPWPLGDGAILVAYAPGPIDLDDATAAPDFDIVRVEPAPAFQGEDGLSAGRFRREVVVQGPDAELWPRPVQARPREPMHKALKYDVDRVGKPVEVRGFSGHPDGTPALLQVYDLPLLEAFFEHSVPAGVRHVAAERCAVHGDEVPGWRQVRWARVVGAAPLGPGGQGEAPRFILAEVPLAADGSFQVRVPARVPFDVQSLDEDRMALGTPARWLYTLPGEKHTLSIPRALYSQTCEGCHGDMSGRRSQSFGHPDVVSSASRTLAMWDSEARVARAPAEVAPLAVGWDEDVAPLAQRRCGGAGCHPRLDAETLRRSIDPGGLATQSRLVELLLGRELGAPGSAPAEPHVPGLSRDELLTLTRWIDLGAPQRRARLP